MGRYTMGGAWYVGEDKEKWHVPRVGGSVLGAWRDCGVPGGGVAGAGVAGAGRGLRGPIHRGVAV